MGNSTPTPRAKCTKLTGQHLLPFPRDLSAKVEGLGAPTSKQIQLNIRYPFIQALRRKYTKFILPKKLLSAERIHITCTIDDAYFNRKFTPMILFEKVREKACLWNRLTRMQITTETLLFVGPKIRFIDVKSLAKFSLRTTYILFIATCALQLVDHILRVAVIRPRKVPKITRIVRIVKH